MSASLGAQQRRQCLTKACVASKQLWCLFCIIWRACCPCSIQGFHTSLTHFSLPGFLLTGHKLSGGKRGLRSEKKDQSGPYFSWFLPHILCYNSTERVCFISKCKKQTCCLVRGSLMYRQVSGFVSWDGAFWVHPLGATLLLTLYVILMSVAAQWLMWPRLVAQRCCEEACVCVRMRETELVGDGGGGVTIWLR